MKKVRITLAAGASRRHRWWQRRIPAPWKSSGSRRGRSTRLAGTAAHWAARAPAVRRRPPRFHRSPSLGDAAEHAETDPGEIQSSEAHTPTKPAQPASDPDPQRRVLAGGAAPGAGVGGRERSPDAPLTWRRRWEAIAVSVGGGGGGDAGGDGGDGCGRWATVRGSKDMKLAFFFLLLLCFFAHQSPSNGELPVLA